MSTEPLPEPLADTSSTAEVLTNTEPMTTTSVPEPIAVTDAPVSAEGASVGRYTHAQLQAMVGKRGRKPPEFYQAFPRSAEAASSPTSGSAGKKPRAARTKALPAVSSAVIGEHTIDELLAMIGTTGRKPVAFEILQQSAQFFADAKAIDLPPAPVDPLVAAFAAAPKGVREAILALLAATKKR